LRCANSVQIADVAMHRQFAEIDVHYIVPEQDSP
jgi:uncharacterized protein (UPF0305 family)